MSLRFYNTLGNSIEEFKEIKKGSIGIYTCGPTVYDYAHIGNFRTFVFQDLVKRYFLYRGYQVKHIMNLTDIDDRTINKANELNLPLNQITKKYIAAFFEDVKTLNIIAADEFPRATEYIEEMLNIIDKLLEKGMAYKKGGSVYFSIGKFKAYGRLANITAENLKTGHSVESDHYDKDNVQDFVLWKGKKANEPCWETRHGAGRPGWHLECSAISSKFLGNHFDIHMGGVDLIFPHHENEIAQSECANNEKFVNYWIHSQYLIVDNQKMSKSLGNFYTLRDLVEKDFNPMAIRYLLISTHYRKLLNFTFDSLKMATQSLKRINDFIFFIKNQKTQTGETDKITELVKESEQQFIENLDNDFNISGALGVFFDFIRSINLNLETLKDGDRKIILDFVSRFNRVTGIIREPETVEIDNNMLEKIEERETARKEKNFELADSIRDELKSKGISLIDTPNGVKWKIEKQD